MNNLSGIKIVTNKWLPTPHTYFFPDWRQRLQRNLTRSSTGKWEPLSEERGYDVWLIGGDFVMNPKMLAILKNVSKE